tara:strand:+ start:906 stop:1106 length:201 start_codon:yes stop_codon:yes gene_type:complete
MIENIKARFNCKRFNVWTEQEDANRKRDDIINGDYIYNETLYYGNPFFIFFKSSQNSWYKDKAIKQ